MELLKQLIQIQITPDQIIFTGKWLFAVPVIMFNMWVHWRALKSFGRAEKVYLPEK